MYFCISFQKKGDSRERERERERKKKKGFNTLNITVVCKEIRDVCVWVLFFLSFLSRGRKVASLMHAV